MSENTAAIEDAKSKRTSAKGRFTRKRNFLIKSVESDQGIEVVETNYANLAEAYDELEGKHETYVDLLPDEQSEEEEAWMTGVQEKFNDATDRKIKYGEQITLKERRTREDAERQVYIDRARTKRNTACEIVIFMIKEKIVVSYANVEEAKGTKQESIASASFLQLEKVRMPHFDGKLHEYPQFKRDFQKHVMTQTRKSDDDVLRTCLDGEPARLVKRVDDDIDWMWQRLDEKYGDPAQVADVIIDEIQRFKMLREGEDKRFIEFVNLIEDGYRDLKRLGLGTEITTTSSVSVIAKALPPGIKRKWSELVSSHDRPVDKSNNFQVF